MFTVGDYVATITTGRHGTIRAILGDGEDATVEWDNQPDEWQAIPCRNLQLAEAPSIFTPAVKSVPEKSDPSAPLYELARKYATEAGTARGALLATQWMLRDYQSRGAIYVSDHAEEVIARLERYVATILVQLDMG